jgi:hypothetical protein
MGPSGPTEYRNTGTMRTARIANPIEISGVREEAENSSSGERFEFIITLESQCGGGEGPKTSGHHFMDHGMKQAPERNTLSSLFHYNLKIA